MKAVAITLAVLIGAVVAAAVGLAAALVGAVRTGDPERVRRFTRFQRDRVNPRVLQTAGSAGDRYAVVEHVGRTSGTPYETPVGAVRDGDHWYVMLVYGPQTSWARNLVAAGGGSLRSDGERRTVVDAVVVPVAETPFVHSDAGVIRFLGIQSALRLRDAGVAASTEAVAE
ncbi:nitroreductase family deazaflavin-dependent oxidoreductase [Microbacterium hominis]|uniref:Nitroreductase family deazaflavin-dependent oxidoreductase n=1 Tax=Microbacterium hominis TaxID=162426 RepID=A0A7D4QE80_9MICO|nr:nitroreductase family deazaflavin-dependent oxidoreductase [Microbacterium hominis]QKJ20817.1 nitroreductase family deazaflavin-dependent oxidoreductase [Microbacterium hominis]